MPLFSRPAAAGDGSPGVRTFRTLRRPRSGA